MLTYHTLEQWFFKHGGTPSQRGVNKFQEGASLYVTYNVECMIIKLSNEYVCFKAYIKSVGLETQDKRETWQKKD